MLDNQKLNNKHLSNIFDHRRQNAEIFEDKVFDFYHCYSWWALDNGPIAMRREWQQHLNWINSNIIGPPKATEYYTQEELEKMGMIGIYEKSD